MWERKISITDPDQNKLSINDVGAHHIYLYSKHIFNIMNGYFSSTSREFTEIATS